MLKAECCNHKAQLSPEFEPGQALAGSYPNESTPSWLFFGYKRVSDENASKKNFFKQHIFYYYDYRTK